MEDAGSPIRSVFQKEMELGRMQSDLRALRKLYRFLQTSKDGERSAGTEILDEDAWLLMKNLLDDATERVLKTNSMIVPTAGSSVSATPRSSKLEQERNFLELQSFESPSPLKISPGFTRNSFKDSNFQSSSLQKDDYSANREPTPELVPNLPRMSISSLKPEPRKKICGACKQNNMKHQNTTRQDGNSQHHQKYDQFGPFRQVNMDPRSLLDVKERRMLPVKTDEKPRQKKVCRRHHGFPSTLGSVACSSRSLASVADESRNENNRASEIDKKEEAASSICKEMGNTIQKIESHISALQLCSELVHTAESSTKPHAFRNMPSSASPRNQTHNWVLAMSKLDQASESDLYRDPLSRRFQKNGNSNRSQQHDVTSDAGKDEDWIETWSREGSQRHHKPPKSSPYGNQIAKRPPLPSKPRNSSHNLEKASKENMAKLRSASPSPSVESKAWVRLGHDKGTPHQIPPSGSHKVGQNRIVPHQLDSEDSTSFASQVPSSGSSDSEETYFVPDEKAREDWIETWSRVGNQRSHRRSPYIKKPPLPLQTPNSNHNQGRASMRSTVKNSVTHGHKKGTQTPHQIFLDYSDESNEEVTEDSSTWTSQLSSARSSYTYSSDSEAYSVPGEKSFTDTTRESSVQDRNWSSSDNVDVRSQSHTRSLVRKKSPKRVGRLRRLKNKLGLIFHHHHHHHHHHHDGGRWKKLRNVFHRKGEAEIRENHRHQVDGKLRKSVVKHAAQKNQVGHFHALVQGLMRKKKHKKLKAPDDVIGRSRRGRDKKAANKLQWWRMIQQQRGTKALKGGRGRSKIDMMSKKKQLRN